jgi:hypothetical protein
MRNVIACIDSGASIASICDYAAWAAQRLTAPLEFLHALARHPERAPIADFSGSIGLGAQESLLKELGDLDEKRSVLAQRHGRELLDGAVARVKAVGLSDVSGVQRHGGFLESLLDIEPQARLFVLGNHPHAEESAQWHLDHNIERFVRSVQRPVLVTSGTFTTPQQFVIAFDGSATGRKMVEMVAKSPLLRGMPCELVAAGSQGPADDLLWAQATLAEAGFQAKATASQEPVDVFLPRLLRSGVAGLLVMGAYGHSRIRHLIIGSTTTTLLRTSPVPVLILR